MRAAQGGGRAAGGFQSGRLGSALSPSCAGFGGGGGRWQLCSAVNMGSSLGFQATELTMKPCACPEPCCSSDLHFPSHLAAAPKVEG